MRNRIILILTLVLVGSLAVSIGLYATKTAHRFSAILFFPSVESEVLVGEKRIIPRAGSREDNIRNLINEIFLGPYDFELERLVPSGTKLESVLFRKPVAYIDVSLDIIFSERSVMIPYTTIVNGIRRAVSYNFPSIESVIVTIGGELPDSDFSHAPNKE